MEQSARLLESHESSSGNKVILFKQIKQTNFLIKPNDNLTGRLVVSSNLAQVGTQTSYIYTACSIQCMHSWSVEQFFVS